MFGDLTTVSLGFTRGSDEVRRNDYGTDNAGNKFIEESLFVGNVDRWRYRLDVSQILTKNFVVNLGYEAITDEGYLNNPYRQVAIADQDAAEGTPLDLINVEYTGEEYPGTRTSNAVAIRGKYYLPWRAAIFAEYRNFSDSWDIQADMYDIGFTQPIKKQWTVDFHYRHYAQTAASFYSNFFYSPKVYMARDKELSAFTSTTIGGSLSYEFLHKGWWAFDKGSLNASLDVIQFDYEDFLDIRGLDNAAQVQSAQPYSFSASVLRLYFSVWY
jgi:hypothetical protein